MDAGGNLPWFCSRPYRGRIKVGEAVWPVLFALLLEHGAPISAARGHGEHCCDCKGHGPCHAYPVVNRFNGRWFHASSLSSFYGRELEMLLDPSGDSRERRATLDDFVDQKRLGVIRGGP